MKSKLINEIIDTFEQFLELEKNLFYKNVNDVLYWHYIRFYFFDEILKVKGWIKKENSYKAMSLPLMFSTGLNIIKNSLLKHWMFDCKKQDILVFNSANRIFYNGKNMDPYTGLMLEKIDHSYTIWQDLFFCKNKFKQQEKGVYYLNSLWPKVLKRLNKQQINNIDDEAVFLTKYFNDEMGVEINTKTISSLIIKASQLVLYYQGPIKKKLQKKQPKLIILVNHYDPLKMLVIQIAKSLGIYVVELQHGIMGRYNIAYNFAHTRELPTLPNEIFTFGEFWNDTTRIKNNSVKLTSVGMPYFEEKIMNINVPVKNDKTKILFLSQETISHQMAQIAFDLAEKVSKDELQIIIKLHPREYENWYKKNNISKVPENVKIYSNCDLYKLLAECDIYVGVYSTTVLESLFFNKSLFVMESYGAHYFLDLLKKKRADFIRDANDIIKLISDKLLYKNTNVELDYYCKNNSIENVRNRIQYLLN